MKGYYFQRCSKIHRSLERKCGTLGQVAAELLSPLGQRAEFWQQLFNPRRRKVYLEQNRGLQGRDTDSLRQPLGVKQR